MDFQTLTLPEAGVAGLNADALIVVVPAEGALPAYGAAVDAALADALQAGDLERKAGRSLYLPRLGGLKAGRLVLVIARDASAKAFKAAVAAGLGGLKGSPAKHVAVVGGDASAAQAEALAVAAGDAAYHYTHTKPSAAPAPALTRMQNNATLSAPFIHYLRHEALSRFLVKPELHNHLDQRSGIVNDLLLVQPYTGAQYHHRKTFVHHGRTIGVNG